VKDKIYTCETSIVRRGSPPKTKRLSICGWLSPQKFETLYGKSELEIVKKRGTTGDAIGQNRWMQASTMENLLLEMQNEMYEINRDIKKIGESIKRVPKTNLDYLAELEKRLAAKHKQQKNAKKYYREALGDLHEGKIDSENPRVTYSG